MNAPNPDPRRPLDTNGKTRVPLSTLNPGQQCAMKHPDGAYWYPYTVIAHHHMIDQWGKVLLPCPGRSVVQLEAVTWDVPSHVYVYLVDGATDGLKPSVIYGPNGKPL